MLKKVMSVLFSIILIFSSQSIFAAPITVEEFKAAYEQASTTVHKNLLGFYFQLLDQIQTKTEQGEIFDEFYPALCQANRNRCVDEIYEFIRQTFGFLKINNIKPSISHEDLRLVAERLYGQIFRFEEYHYSLTFHRIKRCGKSVVKEDFDDIRTSLEIGLSVIPRLHKLFLAFLTQPLPSAIHNFWVGYDPSL